MFHFDLYFVIRSAEGFNPSIENTLLILFIELHGKFINDMTILSMSSAAFLGFRNFSSDSSTSLSRLDPWFVTGLTDAEGSFNFSILRRSAYSLGWEVQMQLTLGAANNPANLRLLQLVQAFLERVTLI